MGRAQVTRILGLFKHPPHIDAHACAPVLGQIKNGLMWRSGIRLAIPPLSGVQVCAPPHSRSPGTTQSLLQERAAGLGDCPRKLSTSSDPGCSRIVDRTSHYVQERDRHGWSGPLLLPRPILCPQRNIGAAVGQVRTFIQMMTQVSVMDNSGARVVRAIKPLGGPKKRQGLLGDTVVVSVRKPNPKSSFRLYKGDLALGLITQTKRKTRRPDGSYIRFDRNAVCILDKKSKDHIGNRVLGTVPLEVRRRTKDGGKIIDLASMTL